MTTIYEINENPAREIAEGRGPKRYLHCIPVQTRAALPAKAGWPADCLRPGPATPQPTKFTGEGPKMSEVLVRFRATRPGPFTLAWVGRFATASGYQGNWADKAAHQHLKRMLLTGAVVIVEPARGQRPAQWQFTESPGVSRQSSAKTAH